MEIAMYACAVVAGIFLVLAIFFYAVKLVCELFAAGTERLQEVRISQWRAEYDARVQRDIEFMRGCEL